MCGLHGGWEAGGTKQTQQAMDSKRPTQPKTTKATGTSHAPYKKSAAAVQSNSSNQPGDGTTTAGPSSTTSVSKSDDKLVPPIITPLSPPKRIDDDLSAAWQVVTRKERPKAHKRAPVPDRDGASKEAPTNKIKKWKRPTKTQRLRAAQEKAKKDAVPGVAEVPTPEQAPPQAGPSGQQATGPGPRPPEPIATTSKGVAPVKGKVPQRPGKEIRAEKRALNTSTSPRGDYKKQKIDKQTRPATVNYSAAVSSDLKVAITSAGSTNLTKEAANAFIRNMVQSMIYTAWIPEGGNEEQLPVLVTKPVYVEGAIRLTCNDRMTLSWLKEIIKDPKICQGSQLVVKRQADLPRRVRCGMYVPDEFDMITDTRDIGRLLYRQNRWINIKEWLFLDGEKQAEGWFIKVTIPESQIPTILEHNRRLACTINQCYLKFLGKGGKYYETPQANTPGPSVDRPQQPDPSTQTRQVVEKTDSTKSSIEEPKQGDSKEQGEPLPGPSGMQQVASPSGGDSLGTLSGVSLSEGDDAEAMLAGLYLDEEEEDIKARQNAVPFVE